MAVTTKTPQDVILKRVTANRWEISMYRVENRADGPALTVSCNASNRDAAGKDVDLVNLPDQVYTGTRLTAIMADAGARYEAFRAAKLPTALAWYQATRDALYAALNADGVTPAAS